MNAFLYFLYEYYPFWGIPSGIVLFEMAMSYRRRGAWGMMGLLGLSSLVSFGLVVAFFLTYGQRSPASFLSF